MPAPFILTFTGLGALAVNLCCAMLLARFRNSSGSLTRAAFLSARNDAYANIAIIRDWSDSENEFIVLSLKQTDAEQYPIVAELTTLSEGRGFLCKHFEPDGKVLTFTFTYNGDSDLLEGVYTKHEGSKTVTYTISYLKTFPKNEVVNN